MATGIRQQGNLPRDRMMTELHDDREPAGSPDPDLVAAGWERRFIADAVRAREATALYTSLGFEVHAESLKPTEFGPQCGDCQLVACHMYVTIYTRKV
jgi:hypothetical protein